MRMDFVDTHAHLDFPEFANDQEKVVERALNAGVRQIVTIGTDLEGCERAIGIAEKYPHIVRAAIGIHPHDADATDASTWPKLEALAADPRVVAIGETGLDYYKKLSAPEKQREAFARQLEIAARLNKPVAIHCRDAFSDCYSILTSSGFVDADEPNVKRPTDNRSKTAAPLQSAPGGKRHRCLCAGQTGDRPRPAGVMHCFSGTVDHARRFLGLGFLISFAGQLTFTNADKLRETAAKIPVECVMLETDCPFLAPQAKRGTRNEPAYVPYIAGELAAIHRLALADIARITTRNARWLFGLAGADAAKIVYRIRDSVYVNLTERCSSSCVFCLRHFTDYVKGHNLRLGRREPSAQEVIEALKAEDIGVTVCRSRLPAATDRAASVSERKHEPSNATLPPAADLPLTPLDGPAREVVFCGYGEPTMRLDVLKDAAKYAKTSGLQVRLDTNGHGDLINERKILPELVGLVDAVCVSLNAPNAEEYDRLCRPSFGARTFDAVVEFIREARALLPKTEITAVAYPGLNIEECHELAARMNVTLRLREHNVVG